MSRLAPLVLSCLIVAPCVLAQDAPAILSLPELVREAIDRNPEVQMAARAAEAKRARVGQVGALADPMLVFGVINEGHPVPFQTVGERDFSEAYVGISQDLPYPGKRRLRTDAAREEAEAAKSAIEAARRRVAADVAEAYYDLYSVQAAAHIVDESDQLLEQFIKVANTRLAVGQASSQDVLDAEVEVSRLEEKRSQLFQRKAILEARLSRLLFRGDAATFPPPGVVVATALPGKLEDLLKIADEESPVLHEKASVVAQAERKVDLARRDRRPDFSVNFTYHNRGSIDPYYTFGGTVTLPNLHGRQNGAIDESVADLGGARSGADLARADVRYQVTEAYRMAETSERLLRLYDEGILKQSRISLDSAFAEYRVGKVDFLKLVTSWRRLLDYDLTYHEQLAEHEKALARLAVHVGPSPASGR